MTTPALQGLIARLSRATVKAPRLMRNLWSSVAVNYPHSASQKPAIIHLSRIAQLKETQVIQIFRLIHKLGYTSYYWLDSNSDLALISRYDSDLVAEQIIVLTHRLPDSTAEYVLVCDSDTDPLLRFHWHHVLQFELNLAKARTSLPDPIYVPYPDRSVGYLLPTLANYANTPKTIRLFFSGSFRGYQDGPVGKVLRKLERADVVKMFQECPDTRVLGSMAELEETLIGASATVTPDFYLVDTDRFRVPQRDWFRIMAHVDVFLCPPGIAHPMSHNAIEAMAAGAVPVLNYPEWFHPRLRDGVNCFEFASPEDLQRQFERIQHIDLDKLRWMQGNVRDYYCAHLDPDSFASQLGARLQAATTNRTHLILQTELNDYFPFLTRESLALDSESPVGVG